MDSMPWVRCASGNVYFYLVLITVFIVIFLYFDFWFLMPHSEAHLVQHFVVWPVEWIWLCLCLCLCSLSLCLSLYRFVFVFVLVFRQSASAFTRLSLSLFFVTLPQLLHVCLCLCFCSLSLCLSLYTFDFVFFIIFVFVLRHSCSALSCLNMSFFNLCLCPPSLLFTVQPLRICLSGWARMTSHQMLKNAILHRNSGDQFWFSRILIIAHLFEPLSGNDKPSQLWEC